MKFISLVFQRSKQYCVNNLLVFLFYLTGSVLFGLLFICFYGNSVSYIRNSLTQDLLYRQYIISFAEIPESAGNDNAAAFFNSHKEGDVPLPAEISVESGERLTFIFHNKNSLHHFTDKGRVLIIEDGIAKSENVVILSGGEDSKI